MARQTSFGDTLRHARERKGMDLSTAARKLRIRPDILRAIEEGDFARMPPRGYTTNMVGAYARLVGLNPSDLTRAYRDESYQFETGRRPMDRGYGSERSMRGSSGRGGRRDSLLDPVSSRSSRSRSSAGSRGRGAQAPQPQYTNLVQGRQAPGIVANLGSMLPLVIVGAIIILLLVLVIMLAFGNRGGQVDDTPTIPISGMSNPAGTDANGGTTADANANAPQTPAVEPVAPTSAKFAYTVADGKEAYVEVYMDGKTEQAQMVEGPKTEEFVVTGTLRFVTTYPDNVTATLDGEKVELVSTNNNSIYSFTFNFDEYLAQWRAENGVKAPASDSNATGTSGTSDGTSGTTGNADGTTGTGSADGAAGTEGGSADTTSGGSDSADGTSGGDSTGGTTSDDGGEGASGDDAE